MAKKQNSKWRRCVGRYQEYPGAYAWPEYEYLCPVCRRWGEAGNVSTLIDGEDVFLCEPCGERAWREAEESEAANQDEGEDTADV